MIERPADADADHHWRAMLGTRPDRGLEDVGLDIHERWIRAAAWSAEQRPRRGPLPPDAVSGGDILRGENQLAKSNGGRAARTAPGVERIYTPGERAWENRRRSTRVRLECSVLTPLDGMADRLGVDRLAI